MIEFSEAATFSFEEYKLYYESTEKVTDRRLALNSWNYGLCLALIIGIGVLANWAIFHQQFRLVLLIAVCILSIMGMLLSLLWNGQIRDFKLLNKAKFDVLNAMAPKVRFPPDPTLRSAEPFRHEWEELEAANAIREVESIKLIALKASNAEFLVPRAFVLLFAVVIVATITTGWLNWAEISRNPFELEAAAVPAPPEKSTRHAR